MIFPVAYGAVVLVSTLVFWLGLEQIWHCEPDEGNQAHFISPRGVLDWSSPNDPLRDFSGSRNVPVARGQKECFSQGF
jgi:hypothetical protein